ncbi:MAG: hypothetical protein U5R06_04370 [candidate division KSB1 bacterium]|nr:hypothetical protein [candidate division KSB1 bacterium]
MREFTIEDMLKICTNQESEQFDEGWRFFVEKYKKYMYKIAHKACSLWHAKRLGMQKHEVVHDIVLDILAELCKDDFLLLKRFDKRTNEDAFRAYIGVISRRIANRKLGKQFPGFFDSTSPHDRPDWLQHVSPPQKREIYECIVDQLRSMSSSKKNERDILLFNLYVFADLNPDQIKSQPLFHDLGDRVVDVVVHRTRRELAQAREKNVSFWQ